MENVAISETLAGGVRLGQGLFLIQREELGKSAERKTINTKRTLGWRTGREGGVRPEP